MIRAAILTIGLIASPALAVDLEVRVSDAKGRPVENAVVAVYPADGAMPPAGTEDTVVIDQQNKEFVPRLTIVRTGTRISFPNKDDIRHHVYSFSEPKKFELPLYKGTPAELVEFDSPGLVVLGCNIHDWMLGYVFVLDTPWYAQSDAGGLARIEGLTAGSYRVEVRHPRAPEPPTMRDVEVTGGAMLEVSLDLRPEIPRGRILRTGVRDY